MNEGVHEWMKQSISQSVNEAIKFRSFLGSFVCIHCYTHNRIIQFIVQLNLCLTIVVLKLFCHVQSRLIFFVTLWKMSLWPFHCFIFLNLVLVVVTGIVGLVCLLLLCLLNVMIRALSIWSNMSHWSIQPKKLLSFFLKVKDSTRLRLETISGKGQPGIYLPPLWLYLWALVSISCSVWATLDLTGACFRLVFFNSLMTRVY